MKIISFIQEGAQMVPIEVELSLTPGLPRVEFTGLADTSIKESISRLKLAFRSQNFTWPRKKLITINLRPAYIKKTSYGLDLAIAYSLLLKTKQIPHPSSNVDHLYIYGEVTLKGDIETPEDWIQINESPILTGEPKEIDLMNDIYFAKNLRGLLQPQFLKSRPLSQLIKKPKLPETFFSKKSAKILEILASGEHSTLLAGEPGSGKTTLANHLHYLFDTPCQKEFKISRKISKYFGENLSWRPFVSPHHSIPPLSLIGGGFPPFFGEISRAHGGILFLDEYLEFQSKVQESLREPIEQGRIFISRKGTGVAFPARFTLIAATNLCPCGAYIPGKDISCTYSLRRCRSKLERLNGPMLDRFDTLFFSTHWKGSLEVPLSQINKTVERAIEFRKKRKQEKPNGQLLWKEVCSQIEPFIINNLLPSHHNSKRRQLSLLRVARTLADLEERDSVTPLDIDLSKQYTLTPFNQVLLDQ